MLQEVPMARLRLLQESVHGSQESKGRPELNERTCVRAIPLKGHESRRGAHRQNTCTQQAGTQKADGSESDKKTHLWLWLWQASNQRDKQLKPTNTQTSKQTINQTRNQTSNQPNRRTHTQTQP